MPENKVENRVELLADSMQENPCKMSTQVISVSGEVIQCKQGTFEHATSEPGEVKEGTKNSGVPLAIEYTYYSKKEAVTEEFFSSQSVVEDDSRPGKQLPFWT
ncbi:hypothetical protein L195_g009628 [Trifolium pratense]|uniref:Uncharacterized protein n=1 Tax=Trifolium pratense TaxID=57577 RepID=A0A2K3PCH4_TRIPR|nr:hypothetical protein L195_g009628 [Trifolium pratense]